MTQLTAITKKTIDRSGDFKKHKLTAHLLDAAVCAKFGRQFKFSLVRRRSKVSMPRQTCKDFDEIGNGRFTGS